MESPKNWSKRRLYRGKSPDARPCPWRTAYRAQVHGHTHGRVPWVCYPCMASATAAMLCVLVHGRASSVPLLLALRGLYSTSILPCIHLKICPHQNHKIPLVSKDNSHCKHNWIQEVKLDPFSSRFGIKIVINIGATHRLRLGSWSIRHSTSSWLGSSKNCFRWPFTLKVAPLWGS